MGHKEQNKDISVPLVAIIPLPGARGSRGEGSVAARSGLFRGKIDRAFSGCYAILTSPKKEETAVYGYNPALFLVLLVTC